LRRLRFTAAEIVSTRSAEVRLATRRDADDRVSAQAHRHLI
jgi:hypothetical protein